MPERRKLSNFGIQIENRSTSVSAVTEQHVDLDGKRFMHRMLLAAGIGFHFVEGGAGPTVILLARFP